MKVLLALVWLMVSGFVMPSSRAAAQSRSPFSVETNIQGVYAYLPPPAGFDPSTASDDELEFYGYPPRPAPSASAEQLATWKKIVNPALTRIVPKLKATNVYHRRFSGHGVRNSTNVASLNWSGYALVQASRRFWNITGAWMVPVVQQAFGSCLGTDYSAEWVGMDGYVSSDSHLFQSGSETDASCSNGVTTRNYVPWVEWLPGPEFEITGGGGPLPFAGGDYVIVNVEATNWSGGKSSTGLVSYTDVTRNWGVSVAISASDIGGDFIVGKSAEWIVEVPEVNGSIATLANYIADAWFQGFAQDGVGAIDYPGSPGGTTVQNITMVDSGSNPISYVKLTGFQRMWFFDQGSAF